MPHESESDKPVDPTGFGETKKFVRLPTVEDFPTTPRDRAIMQDTWFWHKKSMHSPIVLGLPPDQWEQYWNDIEERKRAIIKRENDAVQQGVEQVGIL